MLTEYLQHLSSLGIAVIRRLFKQFNGSVLVCLHTFAIPVTVTQIILCTGMTARCGFSIESNGLFDILMYPSPLLISERKIILGLDIPLS